MTTTAMPPSLSIDAVRAHVYACVERADAYAGKGVWIRRCTREEIDEQLARLDAMIADGRELPLAGKTLAVKDNIDVADLPTTAACPAYAYTPAVSAHVVQKLCDAGAIVMGKTNLDQFATGLVGTRSPYGACQNFYNPDYIAGGSSSGSAVAVAAGMCDFSLGTDTAGSGRVPAAFNNLVGYKPTCGWISTAGVVPACRTLDCVSIFARTVDEAEAVAAISVDFDPADPFSRRRDEVRSYNPSTLRIGIPDPKQLQFFDDTHAEANFHAAVKRARDAGAEVKTIDFTPFRLAAALLYQGPWLAERLAGIASFFAEKSHELYPATRTIIGGGAGFTAVDAFDSLYRLRELKRQTEPEWAQMDLMLLPTTGTIYKISEIEQNPIHLNTNLGYYTNFVNLLDLSALALPAGFRPDGLPAGVTLIAPAGGDAYLFGAARRLGMLGGAA